MQIALNIFIISSATRKVFLFIRKEKWKKKIVIITRAPRYFEEFIKHQSTSQIIIVGAWDSKLLFRVYRFNKYSLVSALTLELSNISSLDYIFLFFFFLLFRHIFVCSASVFSLVEYHYKIPLKSMSLRNIIIVPNQRS